MGLSKSKQIEIAKNYAKSHTLDLFETMKQPQYRGPNFDWDMFPNMAARVAKVSCYHAFPHRVGPDIEEIVYRESHQLARELVVKMLKDKDVLSNG